jgi:hypothetical protein
MRHLTITAALILSVALPAFAQQRPAAKPRAFVSISFTTQPSKTTFDVNASTSMNRETSTVSGRFNVDGGQGLEGSLMVRAWKRLGVGFGITHVDRPTTGTLQGSYPHPFFFNTPRKADAAFEKKNRTSDAVHMNVGVVVPTSRRLSILVFAGASYFTVTQPYADALSVTETYPYDSVTNAQVVPASESASFVGFNGGADVAVYVTRNIGLGVGLRANSGSKQTATLKLDAYGVNASVGLRMRF